MWLRNTLSPDGWCASLSAYFVMGSAPNFAARHSLPPVFLRVNDNGSHCPEPACNSQPQSATGPVHAYGILSQSGCFPTNRARDGLLLRRYRCGRSWRPLYLGHTCLARLPQVIACLLRNPQIGAAAVFHAEPTFQT
jgi:hypothetical protein